MTTEIVQMSDRDVLPAASPKAFVARLQQTMEAIQEAKDSLLEEGTDFGVIPNTDKPTLFQPGAELMLRMFGYGFRFDIEERVEDWDTPFFRYQVKGVVVDQNGVTIAEGPGEANSREPRYMRRQCPKCESGVWDNRKSHQYGKYLDQPPFACKSKACGWSTQKPSDVPEVFDFSLVNTMIKMAVKRAKVAAALTATGGSHFFTQDVEDLQDSGSVVSAPAQTSRGSQGSSGGSQSTSGLTCPACGSSVYDNRPDIESGTRSDKFPAFKCSNRSCTGHTADGEKVTDSKKDDEPWVTWSHSYFDEPSATEFGSAEMAEVQAHIDTGAITEGQVLPIARRVARQMEAEEPTSLAEIDALPEPVRVAVVEAVAEKIGGGE